MYYLESMFPDENKRNYVPCFGFILYSNAYIIHTTQRTFDFNDEIFELLASNYNNTVRFFINILLRYVVTCIFRIKDKNTI